jgi:CPA1 family monovalent cation:H+ antiporter
LAAALAIPLTTGDGMPFPDRDLILILAFVVVLITLVGQGMTLPWVVRAVGLTKTGKRERLEIRAEEFATRQEAIEAASNRLETLAAQSSIPEDVLTRLRAHLRQRLRQVMIRSAEDLELHEQIATADRLELQLIAAERDLINTKYRQGGLKDENRRKLERELDLRDAQAASVRNEDFWEEE